MSTAEQLKAEANKAFSAKNFPEAIQLYSDAIALDPSNHVLFSNRAAAKSGNRDYQGALEDAEKCIEINPQFSKGFLRKGAALHGLRQYPEAVMAYEEGLQVEPESALLKKGLTEVQKVMDQEMGGPNDGMGMGQLFSDPQLKAKLAANPKTAGMLRDPSFAAKIDQIAASGGKTDMTQLFSDPRMLTVLGVLMGVDISAMERPEGSNEMPPGTTPAQPSFQEQKPSSPTKARAPSPKKEEPKEEPMEVDDDDAKAKKEADAIKLQGNAAYKARKFDEAIALYTKAWETYPKDVTYLLNLSAVYFEQGDYAKCIEAAEKVIEEGRELRASYSTYAKAYGRIGNAYNKQGDLTNAIKFYQKSLTEHRTPDVLTKLREAEKAKSEADKQAYMDPAKSDEAREAGNAEFKAGKFADAVKSYTEAIKRLPTDPRAYNNRASAYQKLMAFPEALKDAEAAMKCDPTFIKAYIRKALVQQAMRDNTKALETLQKAMDADKDGKHANEINNNMNRIMQELQSQRSTETDEEAYSRAMRDPEVAEIMSDPIMRQILSDAQQNPSALMDHMKNPMISEKIQKLINAGIIRTR
ncbi:hypothetical protein CcaverHIS002_0105770 [Cutaneotrichosporon cavernicola]|uniref:STI1 domain-containing protein n=1 Tax=Cutaneotrichosporon cavernicola TaxID=279322 RepID=A0AA48I1J4_9TREE|nr:uncharacterized protein CcaverHIS019_0105720 [Cutaneotrichosporon cavernicola]BEI80048.1 hypothetical protein CcaverHIS002_0105770 [Cutaneotrichosporon cavernicola]BEI87854.1 hypothetical protein CcaverHIS019_0105720 [Cutaneotrichosporon cavernicola]BEI95628.1 hypothetical protein CcaverHIS631_0105770 [Cutaneotrichosporon cavernicola]BEJ03403.1 hypothetical protein CcaverHIS641_0105780 [Cutaneotrichosporon cavernicola]